MLKDYYALLGVEPTADLACIRRAYRKQASACHPDHGGSHARMIEINEAWSILSDPERRTRYDESRRQPEFSDPVGAEDIRAARREAADYPREWNQFEDWLDIIAADFTRAKYGKFHGFLGTVWPTASNSQTAVVFIGVGGFVGVILFLTVYTASGAKLNGPMLKPLLFGSMFAACGGAWVGHWLHQILGNVMHSKRGPREASRTGGKAAPSIVVCCPACRQQLRLPRLPQALAVKCQKCRHVFDLPPSQL